MDEIEKLIARIEQNQEAIVRLTAFARNIVRAMKEHPVLMEPSVSRLLYLGLMARIKELDW